MGTTLPLAVFDIWLMIPLAILGVLIFGRRLPEVGKNLGRTIVEFKKGLNAPVEDVKKSIDDAGEEETPEKPRITAKSSTRPVRRIASTTDEP